MFIIIFICVLLAIRSNGSGYPVEMASLYESQRKYSQCNKAEQFVFNFMNGNMTFAEIGDPVPAKAAMDCLASGLYHVERTSMYLYRMDAPSRLCHSTTDRCGYYLFGSLHQDFSGVSQYYDVVAKQLDSLKPHINGFIVEYAEANGTDIGKLIIEKLIALRNRRAQGSKIKSLDTEELRQKIFANEPQYPELHHLHDWKIWREADVLFSEKCVLMGDMKSLIMQNTALIAIVKTDYLLMPKRNGLWVEKLLSQEYLENGYSFVSVGFLHLYGSDGLIKSLKNQGFTSTQIPLVEWKCRNDQNVGNPLIDTINECLIGWRCFWGIEQKFGRLLRLGYDIYISEKEKSKKTQ